MCWWVSSAAARGSPPLPAIGPFRFRGNVDRDHYETSELCVCALLENAQQLVREGDSDSAIAVLR
jgi:hypothetical protein